jgi:opacity protein-like surface antigen
MEGYAIAASVPRKESPVARNAWRSVALAGLVTVVFGGIASGRAVAQTVGLGARLVSVSGPESPAIDSNDGSNTKLVGGFLRLNASKHLAVELSMDYQSTTNSTETARIRNTPIQASVEFFPLRTALRPYFLGGVGWYRRHIEALNDGNAVLTTDNSEFGYHAGVGGELMMGKHVSMYVDYRYVFVDVNGINGLPGAVKSALSLTSVVGLMNAAINTPDMPSSISDRGSMWTGGVAIYF